MACPIPQFYRQPQLKSPTFFGLGYYFAQKNHLDKPWFCQVPIKFVFGTLQILANAWSEYKAGKYKRPRYKRYKDKIKTLINNNAKQIKVSVRQIMLPKLGKVKVKTLDKRWSESAISTLKIVKLLPRSVYLSNFYGRYRAWAWEHTPGESSLVRDVEPGSLVRDTSL